MLGVMLIGRRYDHRIDRLILQKLVMIGIRLGAGKGLDRLLGRGEVDVGGCEQIKAEEEVEKIVSPLDGNELMSIFGGHPGPWIGRVKDYLLGLVLDGALAQDDKAEAERLAREFLEGNPTT